MISRFTFLGVWLGLCISCVFVFVSFVIQTAHAAFEFHPVGAQAGGVGDVGVAHLVGAEGVFWNPASVVFGRGMGVFATFDRPFGVKALESQAVSGVVRWGRLGLGGTFEGFGFELYREQVFGGVYGVRIGERVGVGGQVRGLVMRVAGQGERRWFVGDLGVRVLVHESVTWGLVARNVSGVQTGTLGQGGAMGVAIRVDDGTSLLASVQKEATVPTGFGLGIEHQVVSMLILRVGIGSQPERMSAGFGIQRGWLALDYAGVWHSILGLSHRVSLRLER